MQTVSATELARNTREVLDRVTNHRDRPDHATTAQHDSGSGAPGAGRVQKI